jgi:YidC/Oxa1 family membrane protein insertase
VIDTVLNGFEAALTFLHDLFEPAFGIHSWGWAIIALTLVVRVALLPLAIKQTRSMRAMQALQPQIKELQKKYKVDRDLMRKDPEQYKAKKAKLNEEMMALYQREGANPAASCLPLLAQAPIFLALFYTLRRAGQTDGELLGAPFYFFTRYVPEEGLAGIVSAAGWPGWLLIILMSGTMFISQKQMMARTAASQGDDSNPMAQQQKILLYVMPVFLAVISFQFPLGILLYWVTTNFWQVAQQWIILREVQHEVEEGTLADKPGGSAAARWMRNRRKGGNGEAEAEGSTAPRRISPGASSGKKPVPPPAGPDGPGADRTDRVEDGQAAAGADNGAPGDTGSKDARSKDRPSEEARSKDVRSEDPHPKGGGPDVTDSSAAGDGGDGSDKGTANGAAAGPANNGAAGDGTPTARREHLPRRRRGGGSSNGRGVTA